MAKRQAVTVLVDLTNGRALSDPIVQPGVKMQGIYIARLPGGVQIELATDGKYPAEIYQGQWMYAGDCDWFEDGLSLVAPALPGQVAQIQYYPFIAGGGPINIGSGA